MAGKRRRWPWVLGAIALVLVIAALGLQVRLRHEIVQAINESERYSGRLDDVNIRWLRTDVVISGLVVEDDTYGVTAIDAPEIVAGIDFGALLRGEIRLHVQVPNPTIRHALEEVDPEVADRELAELRDELLDAPEFTLDRLEVSDATVVLDPLDQPFSLSFEDLDLVVTNFRNRPFPPGELPLEVEMAARMSEGGTLRLALDAEMMAEVPEFDLLVDARGLALPAFSPALEEMAELKLTDGSVSFHLEAGLRGGAYQGDVAARIDEAEVDPTDEAAVLEEVVAGLSGPVFGFVAWITTGGGVPRSTDFEGELDNPQTVLTQAITDVTEAAVSALLDIPVVGPLIPDPTG